MLSHPRTIPSTLEGGEEVNSHYTALGMKFGGYFRGIFSPKSVHATFHARRRNYIEPLQLDSVRVRKARRGYNFLEGT